ncbi:hypothetical protein DL93DRAFT_2165168 [Clavulina sp. PMI_390]|nr:hypothetical protein DL93DRAFT_2165168 [Clavulina sp. PMI_390]
MPGAIFLASCRASADIMTWIMLIRSTDILRGAANTRRTVLLIAIPWLAFVTVFVGSLLTGLKHRQEFTRERHLAYCSFPNDIWFTVSSILAGLALLSSLALTFHGLYFWHRLKAASPVLASNKKTDVPMMVRVALLTVTELIGALMSILSLASAINVRYADLVIATLPFGAWLIFVTQRDVLNEYVFWAKFLYHLVHHRQRLSRNEGSRHRPQETIVSFRTTVDRHLSPPSQLKSMRSTRAMDEGMPDDERGMFYLVSLPMNSSQKLDNKSVEFSDEVLNVPEGKKDMGDDR